MQTINENKRVWFRRACASCSLSAWHWDWEPSWAEKSAVAAQGRTRDCSTGCQPISPESQRADARGSLTRWQPAPSLVLRPRRGDAPRSQGHVPRRPSRPSPRRSRRWEDAARGLPSLPLVRGDGRGGGEACLPVFVCLGAGSWRGVGKWLDSSRARTSPCPGLGAPITGRKEMKLQPLVAWAAPRSRPSTPGPGPTLHVLPTRSLPGFPRKKRERNPHAP